MFHTAKLRKNIDKKEKDPNLILGKGRINDKNILI